MVVFRLSILFVVFQIYTQSTCAGDRSEGNRSIPKDKRGFLFHELISIYKKLSFSVLLDFLVLGLVTSGEALTSLPSKKCLSIPAGSGEERGSGEGNHSGGSGGSPGGASGGS